MIANGEFGFGDRKMARTIKIKTGVLFTAGAMALAVAGLSSPSFAQSNDDRARRDRPERSAQAQQQGQRDGSRGQQDAQRPQVQSPQAQPAQNRQGGNDDWRRIITRPAQGQPQSQRPAQQSRPDGDRRDQPGRIGNGSDRGGDRGWDRGGNRGPGQVNGRDDNRGQAGRDNAGRGNNDRRGDNRDRNSGWQGNSNGRGNDRSPGWQGNNGRGNDRGQGWQGNNNRRGDNDRWRGNGNGQNRSWDRSSWRRDNRYDWQSYRNRNRSAYSIGRYYSPYQNYSYRRLGIGFSLGSMFYGNRYWINDPWQYRLPAVYGDYRWVRYYDDVLLVDTYSGEVVDVIYDFFW